AIARRRIINLDMRSINGRDFARWQVGNFERCRLQSRQFFGCYTHRSPTTQRCLSYPVKLFLSQLLDRVISDAVERSLANRIQCPSLPWWAQWLLCRVSARW